MIYLFIIIGLVLDRFTKILAVEHLKGQQPIVLVENYFEFSYVENRGAAFGIFQGQVLLLAAFTIAVLLGFFLYYWKTPKKTRLFTLSVASIVTGALGNLFDRVVYGHVVDFITVHWRSTHYFPSFNVADIFITVGTGLLILHILKDGD